MKLPLLLVAAIATPFALHAADRSKSTTILDEVAVKNLGIRTVTVESRDFEQTIFAVGRVEEIPGNRFSVSSRISGRAIAVNAFAGETVRKGQVLARVESRQPGNPPPTIDLRAPHDGLITASHVLQGQPVEPDKDLLDISDRSQLWVIARISESVATGIDVGTPAHIRFPALGGEPITSRLLRFGVEADRDAGTIEGIFPVENADGRLLPGMRAEFSIVTRTRKHVMAVPDAAIQGDPSSRVVYVKDFELPHAFIKCPVVLGERSGGWTEVKQGLFPGDDVVTTGAYGLGFAASGGNMSLKEALDAAHGHEHNTDGSEMTPGKKAAHHDEHDDHDHEPDSQHPSLATTPRWLLALTAATSLLMLGFAQLWWNAKRTEDSDHA